MSSSGKTKSIKAPLWRKHVVGLPNAVYFLSENKPQDFDHVKYLMALSPSSGDRKEVTDTWRNMVVPSLESSDQPELHQAGRRLAREWVSKKSAREKFWASLKEEELEKMEKERRKRRLERLKATADISLEDAESLLADETRVDIEEERSKLQQQIGKVLTATANSITGGFDISESEAQLFHEVEENGDEEEVLINTWANKSEAKLLKRPKPRPPISTAGVNPSAPSSSSSASTSSATAPLPSCSPTSSSAGPLPPKRKRKGSIVETEEPWRSLMHCLIKIVNGEKNIIYPHPWPTMPHVHKLLFQLSVDSLKVYEAQPSKEKDITLMKDAQVAMSCLINTISGRACTFFNQVDPDLINKARAVCELPKIDLHPATAILEKYKELLAEKGAHQLLRRLAEDWGKLSAEYQEENILPAVADIEDRTLQVLMLLCKFVIRPHFGAKAPSENDILMLWVSVFSLLAKNVTLHTGEKAMLASKAVRQMQSSEFGDPSDSGRKADCLFMFGEIELSNIEFKRDGIDETELRVQNRKNVRLGRCLQESHVAYGVEAPSVLMADVVGYVGVVYQVVQMGNVAVAGKATPHIVQLPSTDGGLLEFMASPSLAILWNFMIEPSGGTRPEVAEVEGSTSGGDFEDEDERGTLPTGDWNTFRF